MEFTGICIVTSLKEKVNVRLVNRVEGEFPVSKRRDVVGCSDGAIRTCDERV